MRAIRTHTPIGDAVAGARAMVPWLVGIVPYGLVIGVSAARAHVPTFAGWLSAPLVFSGSAQVAIINLLGAGATPLVVIVAALAINSRLVLYSATMAPHWRDTPRWWRALAAALLIDPTTAVGVRGYEDHRDEPQRGHRFYLGAAALLWIAWVAAAVIGATVGANLPQGLRLEYIVPIFLVGEVTSRLDGRVVSAAAGAAVIVAVLAYAAPLHLGPLLAMAAGIAAGLLAARYES